MEPLLELSSITERPEETVESLRLARHGDAGGNSPLIFYSDTIPDGFESCCSRQCEF